MYGNIFSRIGGIYYTPVRYTKIYKNATYHIPCIGEISYTPISEKKRKMHGRGKFTVTLE